MRTRPIRLPRRRLIVSFVITYVGEITTGRPLPAPRRVRQHRRARERHRPRQSGQRQVETTAFSDDDADDNTIVYYTFSNQAGEREIKSA
jgi:hypothetical protein